MSNLRTCLNCGEPLPVRSWWRRLLSPDWAHPPTHNPRGPDADACWAGLSRRLGITDPGPRPTL